MVLMVACHRDGRMRVSSHVSIVYPTHSTSHSTHTSNRYGPDVGEATYHSLNTVGRGADAWWSARRIGVKAVAKTTAKVVVKNYVSNLASNMSSGKQEEEGATTTGTQHATL